MRFVIAIPASPEIVRGALRLDEILPREPFHMTVTKARPHRIPMRKEVLQARIRRASPGDLAVLASDFIGKGHHVRWRNPLLLDGRQGFGRDLPQGLACGIAHATGRMPERPLQRRKGGTRGQPWIGEQLRRQLIREILP